MIRVLCLRQNTLFDNLIDRRGRKAQTGIEAPLNLGEVIAGHFHNGVDRFLTCHHDPDLATASPTNFLYNGL